MPIYVATFWLASILLLLAAVRWGGWPEITIAAANLAGVVATRLVRSAIEIRYHQLEVGIALVDCSVLAIFLLVALKSDRWWPLCATALLAPELSAHAAVLAQPRFLANGYSIAGLTAYLLLPVLAAGIWSARHRTPANAI